jgi:hypothetical protein
MFSSLILMSAMVCQAAGAVTTGVPSGAPGIYFFFAHNPSGGMPLFVGQSMYIGPGHALFGPSTFSAHALRAGAIGGGPMSLIANTRSLPLPASAMTTKPAVDPKLKLMQQSLGNRGAGAKLGAPGDHRVTDRRRK